MQATVLVEFDNCPPSTAATNEQAAHVARQRVLHRLGGPLVQRCQLPLQPSPPLRQIVLEHQCNVPAGNAAPGIDAAEVSRSWLFEGRAHCPAVRAGQATSRDCVPPGLLPHCAAHRKQIHPTKPQTQKATMMHSTSSRVTSGRGHALPSHCVHRRALLSCLVHPCCICERWQDAPYHRLCGYGGHALGRAVMFTGAALSGLAHRCAIRSDPGLMWGTIRMPVATAAVNRLPCSSLGT